MSKKDSEDQKKSMSVMFRGRAIFKPLNTGWIDEHAACVREWIANIFFYTKNGTTIMIDAGYNYDRLREKMGWLDIDPASIAHILITHQDTDHVGALERDSEGLFRNAVIYLSEIENRYLTGEARRKVIHGLYRLPLFKTDNRRVLLRDGEILHIGDIKIECILCPGHTWGHTVYLIDDEYLFTGDTIWFGAEAATASSPRWPRTTGSRSARWPRWKSCCADGRDRSGSSPATPAGRTISTPRFLTQRSCAVPSQRGIRTPRRPTTAMRKRTTPRKKPARSVWRRRCSAHEIPGDARGDVGAFCRELSGKADGGAGL